MKQKIDTYLGFAKKSRNLITGYNTCIYAAQKNKLKLLLITEDVSDNTKKKFMELTKAEKIPMKIYGTKEQLSKLTGEIDKGIFGITDSHFAQIIGKELDNKMD
ncbi:L7Ae/L30e/S12e/Gadd45 family ribosomal protein [Anaerovorax sp. IOR16]|uniref:L7Ae/L30e/S12e/Gadd45 family ribosomal protein n=1 Tax=Anaerovorax sp. IOR16 TaxID=2773458 RepID=UPI0019D10402|nr:ribosomal L7Ae/L30e/S12e/Gadd45 family protein [Anaerovorax sp. IOR16]